MASRQAASGDCVVMAARPGAETPNTHAHTALRCAATVLQVLARAGGRYSMVQVREAVDALQNEGHVYSTIDDNHFKSCNAI